MATATVTSRVARRLALATSGRESLKGELVSLSANLWFILFLLLPTIIVVFFGFASVSADLSISYTQLTNQWYIAALTPFGLVFQLTIRTLLVSAGAALGALVVSLPIAYYLARVCSDEHRGILVSLIIIPFWISFVVQVYALLPWVKREGYVGIILNALGVQGFADWLFKSFGYGTANIVVPALIWIWLPFMLLPMLTSFLKVDPALIEAAQNLGAGKWKTFWKVTFPLAYNGIISGTILVFITAFGSFVEPRLLGGQAGSLVGNYIYESFLEYGYLPVGAATSVVVLIPTIVLLYIYVIVAEEAGTEFRERSRTIRLFLRLWEGLRALPEKAVRKKAPAPVVGDGPGMRAGPLTGMTVYRGRFEKWYDRIAARHGKTLLRIYAGLIIAAFYVPMAQVVIFSFNHDNNIINWSSFSTRWYLSPKGPTEVRSLFSDPEMMSALYNSVFIAIGVTLISLLVGVPAALGIVRYRYGSKSFLNVLLYTGLVMPSIIMGVSILVFITFLNDLYLNPYLHFQWLTGYASIIVGHVTFCIPIVIVVLIISFREFDRSIEEAAMNLGADEITTFLKVTIPNIMPGIVSAALLSFSFSFSEVVTTIFLKGQGVETLPVVFWATLSKKIPTPELNAASTLILGLSILFVLLANKVQRGGATLFRF